MISSRINLFKLAFNVAKMRPSVSNLHVSIGNPTAYNDGTYVKTSMTQLKPEEGVHLQITSFNQYGFLINGNIRILGPIAIFPKTIFSWNISDISDINEKSLLLFKMLEPKIDILVIGTGDKYAKIDPNVPKWLIQNKINNFEILPTEKAISVFNFLVAENRFVGAVLLPSNLVKEQDPSAKRIQERAQLYREIEKSSEPDTKKIAD